MKKIYIDYNAHPDLAGSVQKVYYKESNEHSYQVINPEHFIGKKIVDIATEEGMVILTIE